MAALLTSQMPPESPPPLPSATIGCSETSTLSPWRAEAPRPQTILEMGLLAS